MKRIAASTPLAIATAAFAQTGDPLLDYWVYNRDGRKGTTDCCQVLCQVPAPCTCSPAPLPGAACSAIRNAIATVDADVTHIHYSLDYVYISSNNIPSHPIGPWVGNPNLAQQQSVIFRLPRNPTPALTPVNTPVGPIGIAVNGVYIFNPTDANPWEPAPTPRPCFWTNWWYFNAMVSTIGASTMDEGMGHPDALSRYHYHCGPMLLREQLGDHDGHCHSPLLGFAADGYPIYGPYGYANRLDAESPIVRMTSSYRAKDYPGDRPDGPSTATVTNLTTTNDLRSGSFIEDFEYVAGLGTLDEFNGRVCVTPEYSTPTFAYFMTVDEDDLPVYPFIIGPKFRGVPVCDNFVEPIDCFTGCGPAFIPPPPAVVEYFPAVSFPCPQLCDTEPTTRRSCIGGNITIDAHIRYGAEVTYRWRRNGILLSDGPGAGGVSYSGTHTSELTISNVAANTSGDFDCKVTGHCGELFTPEVTFIACYANCDCSVGVPMLTANDFQCFLNRFAAADTYTNCDGSTGTPALTANDFQCFLNTFAAGCS